ncbi:hypothetical protein BFN67_04770 [Pseudaminobacter manganicus]|uniref:Uncharacterized protein n=1 Tax=Manganibacter manganicus TaxID=1873176 RepID=A0A1V8RP00_9HYPH|nr:hypothetical protein BFN67_04770 [Pseudaminobacter manganicus]
MTRLTYDRAWAICTSFCIPVDRGFHALNSQHVQNIIDAADSVKYRQPKNANGSRARYFHAYLCRVIARGKIT